MHNAGVCHRDLKPGNILLDSQFELKLTDFGTACQIGQNRSDFIGTKSYMAPEIHSNQASSYEPQLTDIFALGVILFNLYSGRAPFTEAKEGDAYYGRFMSGTDSFWEVQERALQTP